MRPQFSANIPGRPAGDNNDHKWTAQSGQLAGRLTQPGAHNGQQPDR